MLLYTAVAIIPLRQNADTQISMITTSVLVYAISELSAIVFFVCEDPKKRV